MAQLAAVGVAMVTQRDDEPGWTLHHIQQRSGFDVIRGDAPNCCEEAVVVVLYPWGGNLERLAEPVGGCEAACRTVVIAQRKLSVVHHGFGFQLQCAQEGLCQPVPPCIRLAEGSEELCHTGDTPIHPADQRLHGQLIFFAHGQHRPVDAAVGTGHGLGMQGVEVGAFEFVEGPEAMWGKLWAQGQDDLFGAAEGKPNEGDLMVDVGLRDRADLRDGLGDGCHGEFSRRFAPGVSDGGFAGDRPEMRNSPRAQLLLLRIHHGLREAHRIATQHRKKTLGVGVVPDPGQPGQDRRVVVGHACKHPHAQAAGMLADECRELVTVRHGDPQSRCETFDDVVNMVAGRNRNTIQRWTVPLGNDFGDGVHVAHVGPSLPVKHTSADPQLVGGETADVPSKLLKSRAERNQPGGGR